MCRRTRRRRSDHRGPVPQRVGSRWPLVPHRRNQSPPTPRKGAWTMSEQPSDEQRVIDLSVEVPGTPEQVWQTIATGPGITSWFVPHQVEEHEGGTVRMDFGPGFGEALARVSVWQPPHRVVFSSEGEPALAQEWQVQAHDGGTCVVRLVNSGFGQGDDWDAQYDAMSS